MAADSTIKKNSNGRELVEHSIENLSNVNYKDYKALVEKCVL